MKNRIREYRKQRGWTIRDLAEQIGTSEATISRLETHQMSVSTDWLMRFATIFGVHPADLLEQNERPPIRYVGAVNSQGAFDLVHQSHIDLPTPAPDSVAVRVAGDYPPFQAGDYLLGKQLSPNDYAEALGRYCFAPTHDGRLVIGRFAALGSPTDGNALIVPVKPAHTPCPVVSTQWVAVVQLRISYMDGDRGAAPITTQHDK